MLKRFDAVGFDELAGYVSADVVTNLRLILGRPERVPYVRPLITRCKHGHSYPENLIVSPTGRRYCRVCSKAQQQKRYWNDPEGQRLRSKIKYYGSLEAIPPDTKARRDAVRDMKLERVGGGKHGR